MLIILINFVLYFVGKSVLKSCNEYSIIDCKVANNVKYCICADSLCNNATVLTPIPISTDDEDLDQLTEDGSGLFEDWIQPEHKYIKKNITVELINTTLLNNNSSTETSSATILLSKSIHTFNLVLIIIIYKCVLVQNY